MFLGGPRGASRPNPRPNPVCPPTPRCAVCPSRCAVHAQGRGFINRVGASRRKAPTPSCNSRKPVPSYRNGACCLWNPRIPAEFHSTFRGLGRPEASVFRATWVKRMGEGPLEPGSSLAASLVSSTAFEVLVAQRPESCEAVGVWLSHWGRRFVRPERDSVVGLGGRGVIMSD